MKGKFKNKDLTTRFLQEYKDFYLSMDKETKAFFYPWKLANDQVLYRLLQRVDENKDVRLGAFDKGKLVGQVFVSAVLGRGLYGIAVQPKCQGRGIGRELTRLCIEKCRTLGMKEIHLTAFEDNTKAISFYEKLGFRRLNKPGFFIKRLFTIYGCRNLGIKLFLRYALKLETIREFKKQGTKEIFMMLKL